jgi:hypothetical protein
MPVHFEIVALAAHDKALRKILLEDFGKDDEVVRDFVKAHIEKGNIRKGSDERLIAQLIIALYLRCMEKLIIGMDKDEVRKDWIGSLHIILAK